MIGPNRGRPVPIVIAAILAIAAGGFGAHDAEAATSPVSVVASTTYDVLPDEHRIAVTVKVTATSTLKDTVTRRFYVDRAYLAVPASASNLRISAATGKPLITVSSRAAGAAVLLLRFGSQLASGKSIVLTVTFDMVDSGGAPERALRISPSLVLFSAWGIGASGVPGSTVRVRFPAGYSASIGRGPLTGPVTETDGHLVYVSAPLSTPGTFVADLAADRPGLLVDGVQSVSVGGRTVELHIRAWPDDPDWRARVSETLTRGLPALRAVIGVDWLLGPTLEVRETISGKVGGDGTGSESAGGFDMAARRLDIPYIADPTVMLHGAAHAWFNVALVEDRWIAEGFAGLATAETGTALGIQIRSPAMTVQALGHAVPLNAWAVGGSADDFGYAAALQLARDIEARAGTTALHAAWRDAAAGTFAYQPDPLVEGSTLPPERGAGPLDWRTLLDLIEEESGRSFDGLWRAWVVRPSDAALLDARADARALYAATVRAAAPWILPRSVRDAMRTWQFETATTELQDLMSVVDQRQNITRAAAAAGLRPPAALRSAFEGSSGVAAAAAEAVTEQAVIDVFSDVVAIEPIGPGPLTEIGLLGTDPNADIVAAREAFAAGDLDATVSHAQAARAVWASAEDVGGRRVISGATLAFALVVLLWLLVHRRRAPKRRIVRHAHRLEE
ncbi:MAG: hypothetical protein ABI573_06475 [Chloroflexota bacterium]